MRTISMVLLASSFLPHVGAQGNIGSPPLGFAFDANRNALRPVRGIPGAAVLDEPLESGFAIAQAAVAPSQNFALAVSAEDRRLHLIRLTGAPSDTLVNGAMDAPDRIVFSPTGGTALLHGQDSRMQILSGLPESVAVQELAPVESAVVDTMAVSDDGAFVLLSSEGVRFVGPEQSGAFLALPPSVTAMSFGPGSHDLVAVTHSGDVYIGRSIDTNGDFRQVYAGGEQTADPVGVRFSADGQRAFTANASGVVVAIDIMNASGNSVSCRCVPTVLEPLGSGPLFRLTQISGQPLMLFDAGATEPRVWFVPADSQRSSQ
jgi:DNA-binding beta-propeller fold protein YncE